MLMMMLCWHTVTTVTRTVMHTVTRTITNTVTLTVTHIMTIVITTPQGDIMMTGEFIARITLALVIGRVLVIDMTIVIVTDGMMTDASAVEVVNIDGIGTKL